MGASCSKEKAFEPLTNKSIREAVRLWRHDQAQATEKYNYISKWDTSQVTDMSELFMNCKSFNENISEWDVSNVTNMSYMFCYMSTFNQDVSGWDVSKVTNMSGMFYYASSFNQDVSGWDVSNVKDMSYMFCNAASFNQDVSRWDVSNVKNMSGMFNKASAFEQNLSEWEVSHATDVSDMFSGAKALVRKLRRKFGIFTFFEDESHVLNTEWQHLFAPAYLWDRRKSFMMFLVGQGYVHSAQSSYCKNRRKMKCDTLFDVEDVDRVICKFL